MSKMLRELQRRLKPGWSLTKGRAGHWHIVNDETGEFLTIEGKRWMTSGSWNESGFDKKMLYGPLRSAGVLLNNKGSEYVDPEELQRRRMAGRAQELEVRRLNREAVAKALYDRMSEAVSPVGELTREGMSADLCHIAAYLSREAGEPMSPDLLQSSIHRVIHGGWITPPYQQAWTRVCEEMESHSDRIEHFFSLLRKARGLPETVVVTQPTPQGEDGGWAFEVLNLPIEVFMVDHTYQRPTPWPFVRKTAATFDESLVGTIDVAERGKGSVFAILDGQCRFEACRLVGKKTIWASVYRGLSLEEEARFFLHKNQDRKAIHPYYLYKALLASNDEETVAIESIVLTHGYRVWMSTSQAERDGSIASIEVLRKLYRSGPETLQVVLRVLDATRGRPHAQAGSLLAGLGVVFLRHPEASEERVKEVLALQGPDWLIGRGREIKRDSTLPMADSIGRAIALEYNRGKGVKKLGVWAA